MNTEIQAKLLEVITDIQGQVRSAGEQLPEIASSFISYGRIYETMFFIIMVALIAATIKGVDFVSKNINWEDGVIAVCILGAAACIALFFVALSHLPKLLLVWVAPKVWILAELVKMVH